MKRIGISRATLGSSGPPLIVCALAGHRNGLARRSVPSPLHWPASTLPASVLGLCQTDSLIDLLEIG